MAKNKTTIIEDEILSEKELASIWKTSKRFIEEARRKYGLPYFKIGRLVRMRKSECEQWMEERRQGASA